MRIPIQNVLLLPFISVILSSSDGEYDDEEYYPDVIRDSTFYEPEDHMCEFLCKGKHFYCIENRELCPDKCEYYDESSDIIWRWNQQTTDLSNPIQYYISCAKVVFKNKESCSIEFAKNCSIPNLSFANIFNAVGEQESVNEIRFKSFSNNDIVLQSYHFENLTSLRRLYIEGNMTKNEELPDDIFKNISVLKKLSLNNVGISVQLLKPLARLIVELELIFNNMTTLNDNIFLNFSEMKNLSIKKNNFHSVSKYVFNSTLKLIQLDLNDNNIQYLEDEVFGKLHRLEYLNLSYNNLTKLPNKLLDAAAELVNISIDANKLTELPEDLFRECSQIKFISMKNNLLKSIPYKLLQLNYHLEELDISDNQLQEFDSFLQLPFPKPPTLRKLRLARNRLKYIFYPSFTGKEYTNLQSLVELDVSHNYLKYAFYSGFLPHYDDFLMNVEVINFRNNSLNESRYWINPRWEKLQMVDLSYNQFNSISVEYFIPRYKIYTTFNFTNNPIRNIEFNGVEKRVKDCSTEQSSCGIAAIILEYNSVECNCNVIDLAKHIQGKSHPSAYYQHLHLQSSIDQYPSCQWADSTEKILLNELNLLNIVCPVPKEDRMVLEKYYNEHPVDFCNYLYRPAKKSILVNCSEQAYNLPYRLIKEINKNVELYLTNNNNVSLSNIISNLSWIPSLMKLSLSSNSLKNVDELFIPNTLEFLELDNNEISHLNDAVIGRINESNKLTSLKLHNNPWECSCKTEKMIRFFHDIRKKIKYPDNVTCNETGDSIFRVPTKDLCLGFLDKYLPFIIALIFLALAFAVTLIVHLSYIYKNEIKVWMFANKYLSWLVTEEEIDKDKQYDAFICFSSKDLCFVKNELLPELEKSNKQHPPLKLCVHYRDFIVGEYIPSQIDHFVKISRRTVILLSTNFLKSEWAKIEFRTAHLESLRENRLKVITILLEEINEEDLDDDLRKYISLYTYLKWGEPWFWERLRFALPHPQPTVVSTDLPLVHI